MLRDSHAWRNLSRDLRRAYVYDARTQGGLRTSASGLHAASVQWTSTGGYSGTFLRHTNVSMLFWRYLFRPINTLDAKPVWFSGNALVSINVVTLRQARLVRGWVTICGRINHFGPDSGS